MALADMLFEQAAAITREAQNKVLIEENKKLRGRIAFLENNNSKISRELGDALVTLDKLKEIERK